LQQSQYNEKPKKYYTVGTVPKSNRNVVEIDKIDIPNTHIHDCSITWLSTGTLIKGGGAKLVLWARSIANLYQLIHTPNHT